MAYKPGLIGASLFDGKKKSHNAALNDLFSKKTEPLVKRKTTEKTGSGKGLLKTKNKKDEDTAGHIVKAITNKPVKNDKKPSGKRKHEDKTPTKSKKVKKDSLTSDQTQSVQNPDSFPYVHEALVKKSPQQTVKKDKKSFKIDEEDEETKPKTRVRRKRDKTSDKRTIFVGNCPLSADKKDIKDIFKDYGAIESIRFRCGPTAKLELPKRAVMIKKEFHDKASSYVCFIVFKDEEAAAKALGKNGHVLDGHHLRVDLASNQNQHDKRRSIFVGNLPFTVTEDDLRSHFEDCGDILNVRVVRDRQTSIGKGIAYIQFDSRDGVVLSQKLNDMEFQERKLRVMTCSKPKQKKTGDNTKAAKNNPSMKKKALIKITSEEKAKDFYSTSNPVAQKRRANFAPTNKTTKSFRDIFEAKKEKRVHKMKKKKQRSQKKTDALSSIFGDIPADMKKLQMENPKFKGKKPKDKKKEKLKAKKKLKKISED